MNPTPPPRSLPSHTPYPRLIPSLPLCADDRANYRSDFQLGIGTIMNGRTPLERGRGYGGQGCVSGSGRRTTREMRARSNGEGATIFQSNGELVNQPLGRADYFLVSYFLCRGEDR